MTASVSVRTEDHPNGWVMVPVTVCGLWQGHFLLNTFTPVSSVSRPTASILEAFQCFSLQTDQRYLLQGLTVGGERLTDLEVRISRAATLLGVEGMLGLDFLRRFTRVQFDVAERRLTLTLP